MRCQRYPVVDQHMYVTSSAQASRNRSSVLECEHNFGHCNSDFHSNWCTSRWCCETRCSASNGHPVCRPNSAWSRKDCSAIGQASRCAERWGNKMGCAINIVYTISWTVYNIYILSCQVCSPGGSTIVGIHELEKGCVRSAFINAVEKATERNHELGNLKKWTFSST